MIVFVYVPGFYAAVEQADDVSCRGRALIVGGDPRKRGTVTAASAEARDAGIRAGMPVSEALALCPEAVLRPTRLKRQREVAAEMRSLLRSEHDRIEELGPDGTFVELPDTRDAVSAAAELCVRLQRELALRAVAGIGPTRFVAYLAARHSGREGIRSVAGGEVSAFLAEFPVTQIWGLGPATAEKLAQHGIERIGDLQSLELDALEQILGRNAEQILKLARGQEDQPLRPKPRPKTLSQERTLERPSVDLRTLGEEIAELAAKLETILARERRAAQTVTLGIGYVDGTQITRTYSPPAPVARQAEIAEIALQLLTRTQAGVRRARRLRLQLSRLCNAADRADTRQLRLF